MQDIVEAARDVVVTIPKAIYLAGAVLLAVVFADRGRKAAAIELAEDARDQKVA
jgi:leucyl aminopeptidase (aminopeptidase T)